MAAELLAGAAVDRVVDEAVVDPERRNATRLGVLEGVDDSASSCELGIAQVRVRLLDGIYLGRVQNNSALESQFPRSCAVRRKAIGITEPDPWAVDRCLQSGRPSGDHDPRSGIA